MIINKQQYCTMQNLKKKKSISDVQTQKDREVLIKSNLIYIRKAFDEVGTQLLSGWQTQTCNKQIKEKAFDIDVTNFQKFYKN